MGAPSLTQGAVAAKLIPSEMATETLCERYASPLRYPGGKGSFAGLLREVLKVNFGDNRPAYAEPFAGGAGAALRLLFSGHVSGLMLNDADRRIYCFWQAVLTENRRFCEKVQSVPLTISEWKKQKAICAKPRSHRLFDVGFAAFYLNRCNRSGVIRGAGPIGGYTQTAEHGLEARFNRTSLVARLQRVGDARDAIQVSNLDALDFLVGRMPRGNGRKAIFVYLDPPYVGQGRRLYMNRYRPADHRSLASYLKRQRDLPWMVSYDDSKFIRSLYDGCTLRTVGTWYSLQNRKKENELLFLPDHVKFPAVKRATL